ncbi:MAG: flagellar brake protein [Methylococcaceae bacterium]|nr:flagellar brake protein [Methylococcaceae bacterium]
MSLSRLGLSDLPIDIPLPYPIFAKSGLMLLPKGGMIAARDAEALVNAGVYRRRYGRQQGRSEPTEQKMAIPGLSLPVENVHLKLKEEGSSDRISVPAEFLGLIPGNSLIVSQPLRAGRLINLGVGQRLTVHMLVRKHIHAFPSEILCMYKFPIPYLHLSYPDGIESSVVRTAARINVSLLAVVQASEHPIPASISNLSGNGMAILCEHSLGEIGDRISLGFTLPIIDRPCHIETVAILRNMTLMKAQKVYQFGLQLDELNPEQRVLIEAFIYHQV